MSSADKKPMTAAERQQSRRDRLADTNTNELRLRAHPEDHGPITGYAAKLAKARAKSAPAKKKAAPKG